MIRGLFERLRNHGGQKDSYPTECGRFSISTVRDLTTGYDSNQPNNKAVSAHMDTCTVDPLSTTNLWPRLCCLQIEVITMKITFRDSILSVEFKNESNSYNVLGM